MKQGCRWIAGVLCLCLLFTGALAQEAEEILVSDFCVEGAADSYVRCPVLTIPQDEELSAKVNQLIQTNACVSEYVHLISQITEGSTGLRMDYAMTDADRPFVSIVFSVSGKMLTGRPSQKYYPMVIDMTTGEMITPDQVFLDDEEAMWALEAYMEEHVTDILSTHMENSDLLPVPFESFALDESGITFYYDASQLSFLSGYSGAVTVPYHEMAEYLDISPNSVLGKMGIAESMIAPGEKTAERIAASAAEGKLGALPAVVGMNVKDAFDRFRSTIDAGFYPGGAYYEMEDSHLRDAVLLTDVDETAVTGILAKRISLWGIRTGITSRDEWQQILGKPQFTMEMGENDGSMYLLCAGTSDYYDYGEYTLQLHADKNGILYAAVLTD